MSQDPKPEVVWEGEGMRVVAPDRVEVRGDSSGGWVPDVAALPWRWRGRIARLARALAEAKRPLTPGEVAKAHARVLKTLEEDGKSEEGCCDRCHYRALDTEAVAAVDLLRDGAARAQALEVEKGQVQGHLEGLEVQFRDERAARERAESERDAARQEAMDRAADCSSACQERDAALEEAEKKRGRIVELQGDVATLRERVATLEREKEAMRIRLAGAEGHHAEVLRYLSALHAASNCTAMHTTARDEKDCALGRAQTLKARVEAAERERGEWKAEAQRIDVLREAAERRVQELERQRDEVLVKVSESGQSMVAKTRETAEFLARVRDMKAGEAPIAFTFTREQPAPAGLLEADGMPCPLCARNGAPCDLCRGAGSVARDYLAKAGRAAYDAAKGGETQVTTALDGCDFIAHRNRQVADEEARKWEAAMERAKDEQAVVALWFKHKTLNGAEDAVVFTVRHILGLTLDTLPSAAATCPKCGHAEHWDVGAKDRAPHSYCSERSGMSAPSCGCTYTPPSGPGGGG